MFDGLSSRSGPLKIFGSRSGDIKNTGYLYLHWAYLLIYIDISYIYLWLLAVVPVMTSETDLLCFIVCNESVAIQT